MTSRWAPPSASNATPATPCRAPQKSSASLFPGPWPSGMSQHQHVWVSPGQPGLGGEGGRPTPSKTHSSPAGQSDFRGDPFQPSPRPVGRREDREEERRGLLGKGHGGGGAGSRSLRRVVRKGRSHGRGRGRGRGPGGGASRGRSHSEAGAGGGGGCLGGVCRGGSPGDPQRPERPPSQCPVAATSRSAGAPYCPPASPSRTSTASTACGRSWSPKALASR